MTIIDFGQYKGADIDDVLSEDPEYLVWCYENNINNLVDEELYEKAKKELGWD